jgi:hypothetical protein
VDGVNAQCEKPRLARVLWWLGLDRIFLMPPAEQQIPSLRYGMTTKGQGNNNNCNSNNNNNCNSNNKYKYKYKCECECKDRDRSWWTYYVRSGMWFQGGVTSMPSRAISASISANCSVSGKPRPFHASRPPFST